MRSIAMGLDLGETFFDDKINEQTHNLRLLSYPPIKSSALLEEGSSRAGAHSGIREMRSFESDFNLHSFRLRIFNTFISRHGGRARSTKPSYG